MNLVDFEQVAAVWACLLTFWWGCAAPWWVYAFFRASTDLSGDRDNE